MKRLKLILGVLTLIIFSISSPLYSAGGRNLGEYTIQETLSGSFDENEYMLFVHLGTVTYLVGIYASSDTTSVSCYQAVDWLVISPDSTTFLNTVYQGVDWLVLSPDSTTFINTVYQGVKWEVVSADSTTFINTVYQSGDWLVISMDSTTFLNTVYQGTDWEVMSVDSTTFINTVYQGVDWKVVSDDSTTFKVTSYQGDTWTTTCISTYSIYNVYRATHGWTSTAQTITVAGRAVKITLMTEGGDLYWDADWTYGWGWLRDGQAFSDDDFKIPYDSLTTDINLNEITGGATVQYYIGFLEPLFE